AKSPRNHTGSGVVQTFLSSVTCAETEGSLQILTLPGPIFSTFNSPENHPAGQRCEATSA
ncbi:MAG TPA: hypothetical protein PKE41_01605, partial [Candidatus Macondimonas sp.]|nr:hypothetical protein [Candidatus Macondimonas sp.]